MSDPETLGEIESQRPEPASCRLRKQPDPFCNFDPNEAFWRWYRSPGVFLRTDIANLWTPPVHSRLNESRILHGSSPQEQGNGVPCTRAALFDRPHTCEVVPVMPNESVVGKVSPDADKNGLVAGDRLRPLKQYGWSPRYIRYGSAPTLPDRAPAPGASG